MQKSPKEIEADCKKLDTTVKRLLVKIKQRKKKKDLSEDETKVLEPYKPKHKLNYG